MSTRIDLEIGDGLATARVQVDTVKAMAWILAVVILLLALERISRGGRRFHPTTTRQPPLRPVPLHGWKQAAAVVAEPIA